MSPGHVVAEPLGEGEHLPLVPRLSLPLGPGPGNSHLSTYLHIYILHIYYISSVYSHLSQGPHRVPVEVIMLHRLVLSNLPA